MGIYVDSWSKVVKYSNPNNGLNLLIDSLEMKFFEGLIKLRDVAEYFESKNISEDYNYFMMSHCLQI